MKYKVGDCAKIKNSDMQSVHIIQCVSDTDQNGTVYSYIGRTYMGTKAKSKYLTHDSGLRKYYEMELEDIEESL